MNEIAVELRNVSKVFPADTKADEDLAAIQNVSLQIRHGEFFTLLGPSGCGKTTTLRIIAGFETPTSGDVFIKGKQMNDCPPHHRPVNTVFQNYALFPHLNVAQNIAFGLEMKHTSKAEIAERTQRVLKLVQLPDLGARKPNQLSGGQQQRVALARALVNEPAVLLLDEPLGALDLKLRKEMQIELKHLQTKLNITFIYVTHDQEEALTMSDRIAVMNNGQVLQVDSPINIYERPTSRFVAEFIGKTNFLSGRVLAGSSRETSMVLAGETVDVPLQESQWMGGDSVTLAVRPEKLQLHHDVPAPNGYRKIALHGQVREAVYAGTDTHYVVVLQSGDEVTVHMRNTFNHNLGEFAPGEAVVVTCPTEALRPLAG